MIAVGVLLFGLAWAWRPIWNVDLFWHVATGRVIQAGGLPTQDVFSAANPAAPWSTFQWLYQLAVAGIDDVAGLGGLRGTHALLYGLGLAAWARLVARRAGVGGALAIVGVLLLLFEDRLRARPHLLELWLVVPLLHGLSSDPVGPRRLGLVALAPLWANLHAVSSLWWVALFGAWALPRRDPRALGLWVLGTATILTAPGAWAGLTGALGSHQAWPVEFVPELGRTWIYAQQGPWGACMLLGVGLGVVAAGSSWRKGGDWSERMAGTGCALAAVMMARWAWFAAVPIALALQHRPPARWARLRHSSLCLLALPPLLHAGPRWSLAERMSPLQAERFPVAAADYLAHNNLRVPTDTDPAWSGYLLYRLHPGTTVLADGRLVFGEEVADLLRRRFEGDGDTFAEAVGRFHTLALVAPTGSLPALDPALWRQVYADEIAEVWLPRPAWPLLDR